MPRIDGRRRSSGALHPGQPRRPRLINETFETAITWDRFDAFVAGIRSVTRTPCVGRCLPGLVTCRLTHVYPTARPVLHRHRPGKRSGRLEQWAEVKESVMEALVAGGGTVTHHHASVATTDPATTASAPISSPPVRAAKRAVDPGAILNPACSSTLSGCTSRSCRSRRRKAPSRRLPLRVKPRDHPQPRRWSSTSTAAGWYPMRQDARLPGEDRRAHLRDTAVAMRHRPRPTGGRDRRGLAGTIVHRAELDDDGASPGEGGRSLVPQLACLPCPWPTRWFRTFPLANKGFNLFYAGNDLSCQETQCDLHHARSGLPARGAGAPMTTPSYQVEAESSRPSAPGPDPRPRGPAGRRAAGERADPEVGIEPSHLSQRLV